MRVQIDAIELRMHYDGLSGTSRESGYAAGYAVAGTSSAGPDSVVEFPNSRVLKRLARMYLDSPIYIWSRSPHYLLISMKGGLSKEKRAAFLAAMTTLTKVASL